MALTLKRTPPAETWEEQEAPFAVQIELTEGCNLRCPYCGLNGIRAVGKNDFKWLTVDQAIKIAEQIAKAGWNPRVEFAMHGEPTMNPQHLEIFAVFRAFLPKAYLLIETNGGGIFGKKDRVAHLLSMFEAGLNTVGLDQYQNVPLVPAIWEAVGKEWDRIIEKGITIHEYPADPLGNPHQRNPKKRLVRIAPIDLATKGTHATLNNHAGAGAPKDYSQAGKRCAKPFREISIRWNGDVALCCNDWRGEYKCGNVLREGLLPVWNGPAFGAARRRLVLGQRDFGVCNGCNAVSYRPGLLPDKKGQVELMAPGDSDTRQIAKALAGDPYTAAVERLWERPKHEEVEEVE